MKVAQLAECLYYQPRAQRFNSLTPRFNPTFAKNKKEKKNKNSVNHAII